MRMTLHRLCKFLCFWKTLWYKGASQVALVVKTPPSMQETKRENSARTRACGLQNLKYLLSDPLPAFTYSCPVAAALFEGLVKTQCWLLHPEFGAQGPENWRFWHVHSSAGLGMPFVLPVTAVPSSVSYRDSKSLLSIESHEKRFHQIVSTERFFSNTHVYLQHDNFVGSFTCLQMPFTSLSKLRVPGKGQQPHSIVWAISVLCQTLQHELTQSARWPGMLGTWTSRPSFSGSAIQQEGSRIRIWCYVRLSLLPPPWWML